MQTFVLDSQHFPSGKDYACLRTANGTKTFLRNIAFLHAPRNPRRIVLVHEWDFPMESEWEPPKGQMEWKEFAGAGYRRGQQVSAEALLAAMRDGVCREIAEEAKIPATKIRNLHVLPLSYTEAFKEGGKGAFLRYQFWRGEVSAATVATAQKELERIVGNPAVQAKLTADKKEKDAVGFWEPPALPKHATKSESRRSKPLTSPASPENKEGRGLRGTVGSLWGRIRGGFSGTMTRMYYEWLGEQH